MSFLHPAFLWALTAVSVPLALHLLLRRRVKTVYFPSLALLKLLQHKKSTKMRLAQILLLAARIAVLVVIVLLFAQPFFREGTLSRLNAGPMTVVYLLDNSSSMALRPGDGTGGEKPQSLYDQLRDELARDIADLDARTRVVVVGLAPGARVVFRGGPGQFKVDELPGLVPVRPDVKSAPALLDSIFGKTPVSRRRVVVLSDFQVYPWRAALPVLASAQALLSCRPCSVGAFSNWSVAGVRAETPTIVAGRRARFVIDLSYSCRDTDVRPTRIVATVDGKVVAASDLKPPAKHGASGSLKVVMSFVLRGQGTRRVKFSLDDDALVMDNDLTTAVTVVPGQTVLLLNGAPGASSLNSATFFLKKAYEGSGTGDTVYNIREFSGPGIPMKAEIGNAAVVHLASYSTFSPDLALRLRKYVEAGGTLVVWMGDTTDAAALSRHILQPLMGLSLAQRAEQVEAWRSEPGADTPLGHLLVSPYIRHIVSRRYYFVNQDVAAKEGAKRVAVSLADGTPMIAVYPSGCGHAVFVNASANQDWSDFPLHPIFPVLMSQLPLLTSAGIRRLEPGERFVINVPTGAGETGVAEVGTPAGEKMVLTPRPIGEQFVFVFDATWWPGVYTVMREFDGGREQIYFEVAPDSSESELTYMDAVEFDKLGKISGAFGAVDVSAVIPLRVTDILLLFLLVLLVTEGIILSFIERTIRGGSDGG